LENSSGYVEANDGVHLYYEVYGHGRPIILIHGGGLSMVWWNKQLQSLSKDYRVFALDTRGNGKSGKTPWGHRTARYAMDIRQVLESLELFDVTLVGWSIGARTVLSYIELFRDYRLRGVVLVDECPNVEVHKPAEINPQPPPDDLVERKRWELREMFVNSDVSDQEIDVLLAGSERNIESQGVTLGPDYQAQDWRPMLPSINLPVLITTGGKSGAYPGCLYMAKHIPGANLEVFEKSGHVLFYEEPERFNAVINKFVESLY